MQIHLTNTTKKVELKKSDEANGVMTRIWEGYTDSGIKVHAHIALIAISESESEETKQQFAAELQQCAKPSIEIEAIPLRLII